MFGDGIKKAQQRPAFCLDVVGLRFFRQSGLTACSLDLDAPADLLHPDGFAVFDGHQQLAVLQLPQVLENLPLLIADFMENQLFFFAHVSHLLQKINTHAESAARVPKTISFR